MDKNEVFIQNISGDDTSVHQLSDWCIEALSLSLPIASNVKEPSKNTWLDEEGDEEYIPDHLYMQAYEMTWELGCRGIDEISAGKHVKEFLVWLSNGGLKKIYVPHAKYGRTNVRLSSYSQKLDIYDRVILLDGVERKEHLMTFTIKLKVNDPVSDVTIENNNGVLNLIVSE